MHFWRDPNPLKCNAFSPNQILEFQAVHLMLANMQLPGSRYLITLIVIERDGGN